MEVIRVQADDPRLKPYRALKDRETIADGLFIAEGEVVVRHLLATRRFRADSILLDETRFAALEPLLAEMTGLPPVLVTNRAALSEVAGFHMHRGCLAAVERGNPGSADDVLPPEGQPAVIVAAIGVANHDNMGGIFRNAAAFGADAVLIDEESCDPLYRKAIRVSVGAALSVPFARLPAGEIVARLKASAIAPVALSPRGAAPLRGYRPAARFALLLGAEGPGLPSGILDACETLRIPMARGWDSLNVAATAGIALYELSANHLLPKP